MMFGQGPLAVALYVSLVMGAATLLATWCGWGVSRLLLPPVLLPWRGLLAPLLGYGLVLVVAYWLVRDLVGLPVVLVFVLMGTGLLNLLAWRRTGPPRFDSSAGEYLPLLGLLITTLIVGVAPLFNYGYPAIIGKGWDVENYLPVARYLERGPVSSIATAPQNPLRDLNSHPPSKGLTLGFSIWHGSVNLLTGSEALTSFAPLMAWLRALGILCIYVLFRSILCLEHGPALLGAAFVSAGALMLWVTYFNFAMQLSAWPLIPLALLMGLASLQDAGERGVGAWPGLVGAGLAWAALPVAYYPALTLALPMATGVGIALIAQASNRLRVAVGAASLAALALVMALPTIGAYFQGFDDRYSQQLTTLGIFGYVPLTDFAGLTTFFPPPNLSLTAPLLSWLGLLALAALALVGLFRGSMRAYWLGLIVGAAVYMVWLRWGQQYPYAWMKGGAYAAFPFLGLAAAGVQALTRKPAPRIGYAPAVGIATLLLAVMALSQGAVVRDHWKQARLYTAEWPEFYALREKIPAGSHVTITSNPHLEGTTAGLVSYLLDHTTVLGKTRTGYAPFENQGGPGEIGDYAILLPDEDPALYGYSPSDRIWVGGPLVLYSRQPEVQAHLQLDRQLSRGQSLDLFVGNERVSTDVAPRSDVGSRSVVLSLASLVPARVLVDGAPFDIPAGGSTFTTVPLTTPHKLTLQSRGTTPILLRAATVRLPGNAPPSAVQRDATVAVAQAYSLVSGTMVTTTLSALSPGVGPLVLALDIWDRPAMQHYGWYGLEQSRSEVSRTMTLSLDLPSGNVHGTDSSGKALPLGQQKEPLKSGTYTARLDVSAGTRLLTNSKDLFSFSVDSAGTISDVQVSGEVAMVATAADRPVVPLDVKVGADIQLLGYMQEGDVAYVGQDTSITLWWKSLAGKLDEHSVLLHLQDAKGQKLEEADGPPANGGRPTSTWQVGEVVVDRHTLKIPTNLPAGNYVLVVGMYHYPSIQTIPLTGFGSNLKDGVLTVPLRVKQR